MRYAAIFLILALVLGGCAWARRSRLGEGPVGGAEIEKPVDESAVVEKQAAAAQSASAGGPAGGTRESGTTAEGGNREIPLTQAKEETPLTRVEVEEYTESILNVIETLESCYGTGDYERWKSLLTPLYRQKHDDPAYLRSQEWEATDLNSFFKLLIATRKQGNVTALKISRIEFEKPRKALVYVILDGREFPEPQHTFIKIGNSWLKGLPEEGT